MRYVIMANGRGNRWNNYLGIPKHLISIDGETLLERITRQIRQRMPEAEIIISSSDPRCEAAGARRQVPRRNDIELDRFVSELIADQVCFLYGDTYYSDSAMDAIVSANTKRVLFFGNPKAIVAVVSGDRSSLEMHLERVRELFLAGEISDCKGWQLYQSYAGLAFSHQHPMTRGSSFITLEDNTGDFNTPSDLTAFFS